MNLKKSILVSLLFSKSNQIYLFKYGLFLIRSKTAKQNKSLFLQTILDN